MCCFVVGIVFHSNLHSTDMSSMHEQEQSRLLELPAELQLAIFEYVVQEPEPLLINCGCDSSYGGDYELLEKAEAAWEAGVLHPPVQPTLTRTCRGIRETALPMFYQLNAFRAHYCSRPDMSLVMRWLERMGAASRHTIRDFAFWDFNPDFDEESPHSLKKLRRTKLFREMGGVMQTMEREDCCFHRVTFGRPGAEEDEFEGVPALFAY